MTLDDALLAAHQAGDRAALVSLYREAAAGATSIDASCFYLTHAYVFALEIGDPRARDLHAELVAQGRES